MHLKELKQKLTSMAGFFLYRHLETKLNCAARFFFHSTVCLQLKYFCRIVIFEKPIKNLLICDKFRNVKSTVV